MLGRIHHRALTALAVGAIATVVPAAVVFAHPSRDHGRHHERDIAHVLLISVDGLHQSDVEWYVSNHPSSELAKLVGGGAEYARAQTPIPSDSFPGMTAQVTGGNPRTTGVYYDDEYSHAVLPAGTTSCHGQPTGGEVIYDSPDDKDATALDAGQGLTGLPGSILEMTAQPQSLHQSGRPARQPADLQADLSARISPGQHDLRSGARSRAADRVVGQAPRLRSPRTGHRATAIDDLFTPEIDSNALEPDGTPYPGEISWTGDNAATMQYDSYKVQAVLNEIDGYDHSHTTKVGVPAIFGMNFQTVSTAEKLLTSDGLSGGYLPGTTTPGPLLAAGARLHQREAAGDGRRDPRAGSRGLDRDHRLGQARPVAAGPEFADSDQGRSDHRSDQRRLGSCSPRSRRPDRRRDRRRRVAELPVQHLPAGRRLREGLPVEPLGDRRRL